MKEGWVFFILSVVEGMTWRGTPAAVYPAGVPLSTPAHPERVCSAGSSGGGARY